MFFYSYIMVLSCHDRSSSLMPNQLYIEYGEICPVLGLVKAAGVDNPTGGKIRCQGDGRKSVRT